VNGQQMNAPNNKPQLNYPLELKLTK